MPDQSMSHDEELFLLALLGPRDRTDEEAHVLTALARASDLTPEIKELILDLAVDSPQVRQSFLEWVDRHGEVDDAVGLPRHIQLPVFTDPFINFGDRKKLFEDMLEQSKNRILSIVGPSGAGKTRLALETIAGQPERWADRSIWVNCRSLETDRELVRLIACSLSDQPADWLAIHLDEGLMQEKLLIVLDEFDRQKSYVSAVEFLVREHPNVRFVILSQAAIGFAQKTLTLGEIHQDERDSQTAFDLLLAAIQYRRKDIINLHETLAPIRNMSAKLARLPIGLSLAAGCFATMPPNEVWSTVLRIANTTSQEPISSTQASDQLIRAILDHLTYQEQEALHCLGLLQGSFSQDQAELMVSREVLQDLLRTGLMQATESTSVARFELPESVRSHLGPVSEVAQNRFVSSFDDVGKKIWTLTQYGEWKSALRVLLDNLPNLMESARIACILGQDGALHSLFRSVGRLIFEVNLIPEFETLVQVVRNSKTLGLELEIQILGLEGANASMNKNSGLCEQLWLRRLELSRELGDPFYIADTLSDLDHRAYEEGDYPECIEIALETEAVAVASGNIELVASAKVIRGLAHLALGNVLEGRVILDEVHLLLPMCVNADLTPFVYQHVVMGFDQLDEPEKGRSLLIALLEQTSRSERSVLTGWSLGQLGNRYFGAGNLEAAARCYVAACSVFRLTSSRHYLRAKERLEKFRTEMGHGVVSPFEGQTSDQLIESILNEELG